MNAYELANELQKFYDEFDGSFGYLEQSINMLRQQADRIAELEKQSEPVAWMQMHHKDNIATKFSPVKVWEDDIPLYTTPQTKPCNGFCGEQECKENQKNCERARMAKKLLGSGTPQTKPLSDEEIKEVIRKHWNRKYGNRDMLTLCKAVLEEANK